MLVEVYWNLRKKCYSVRDAKTKRIIDHKSSLCLKDVQFKVSEAGRQRVLASKHKNVHAWLRGELVDNVPQDTIQHGFGVSYDPYKNESFMVLHDFNLFRPIEACDYAQLFTNDHNGHPYIKVMNNYHENTFNR